MGYSLLWILGIVLAVWIIYDVWVKQKEMKDGHKVLWSGLAIIVSGTAAVSGLAALAYYFGVKKKKTSKPVAVSKPKRVVKKKSSKKKATKKKASKKSKKSARKKR